MDERYLNKQKRNALNTHLFSTHIQLEEVDTTTCLIHSNGQKTVNMLPKKTCCTTDREDTGI